MVKRGLPGGKPQEPLLFVQLLLCVWRRWHLLFWRKSMDASFFFLSFLKPVDGCCHRNWIWTGNTFAHFAAGTVEGSRKESALAVMARLDELASEYTGAGLRWAGYLPAKQADGAAGGIFPRKDLYCFEQPLYVPVRDGSPPGYGYRDNPRTGRQEVSTPDWISPSRKVHLCTVLWPGQVVQGQAQPNTRQLHYGAPCKPGLNAVPASSPAGSVRAGESVGAGAGDSQWVPRACPPAHTCISSFFITACAMTLCRTLLFMKQNDGANGVLLLAASLSAGLCSTQWVFAMARWRV